MIQLFHLYWLFALSFTIPKYLFLYKQLTLCFFENILTEMSFLANDLIRFHYIYDKYLAVDQFLFQISGNMLLQFSCFCLLMFCTTPPRPLGVEAI